MVMRLRDIGLVRGKCSPKTVESREPRQRDNHHGIPIAPQRLYTGVQAASAADTADRRRTSN
jgi:hypothetical protein